MSFADNIIQKIQKSNLVPLSKSRTKVKKYLLTLCLIMLLWLGIFAVSFFISDTGAVTELVEMSTIYTIIIWIMFIVGLTFAIYRDSRTVGTLYKYSMSQIIWVTLAIMIIGWSLLHVLGWDILIQKFLIKNTGYEAIMSTYVSWSKPEKWRLIGEIEEVEKDHFILEDMTGKMWTVNISPHNKYDKRELHEIIEEGNTIKIVWTMQEKESFIGQTFELLFE